VSVPGELQPQPANAKVADEVVTSPEIETTARAAIPYPKPEAQVIVLELCIQALMHIIDRVTLQACVKKHDNQSQWT
jgi:hypothetical protein